MKRIVSVFRICLMLTIVCTLLCGVGYTLLVTAVGQAVFNHKAHGSLIERGGKIVGSSLLGQQFEEPKYFWGRLSATTPAYNASASAASNLSPGNSQLLDSINKRISALQKADPGNTNVIPVDLVTASGSGLDPHISLQAAQYQVSRIAKARKMNPDDINALIDQFTEGRELGFMSRKRVNVLRLNLALDEQAAGIK